MREKRSGAKAALDGGGKAHNLVSGDQRSDDVSPSSSNGVNVAGQEAQGDRGTKSRR